MPLEVAQKMMWYFSSAGIIGVVAVMVWCCLIAMRWIPGRWRGLCDRVVPDTASAPCTWRESLFWAVAALAWLWLIIVIGFVAERGTLNGLFSTIRYRFTRQGDASNYLFIAEHGYPSEGNERLFVVFYPLFPLCIRLLHDVFRLPFDVAGVLISHACVSLSAVLMRRLAGTMLDRRGARAATLAMLFYPFLFFCFGVYTESLFMALMLACLLLLRKNRWWPAGVMALLAALCRTQGFALTFACLFAFLSAGREERGPWINAFSALGAPVGFGMYLCMNWMNSGDPFRFLEYQKSNWYHETRWFGKNLAEQLGAMSSHPHMRYTTFLPQIVLYFLAVFLLSWLLLKKKRSPEGVYSVAFLGMSYITSWLISGGRYMFGCVGLFLALGMVKNRVFRAFLLLAEAACLLLFTWRYLGNASMW